MAESTRPAPSTKPLVQKLLLKPGARAAVLNAPEGYLDQLGAAIAQQLDAGPPFDFIQVFVARRDELLAIGRQLRGALKPGGVLWIAYPKGKALPTDLNRDVVRLAAQEVGLEVVSQVAIDDVWSALRAKVV